MINRRNVLIGLGTAVAAGGAAIGTGAFDQVEATRDVEINTAGDDSALIGIDLSGDLDGEDGDLIRFDLDADINVGAVTRFDEALSITNNRESGDVEIRIEDDDGENMIAESADDEGGFQFEAQDESVTDGKITIESGDENQANFDVVFGFDDKTEADAEEDITDEITIIAESP